MSQEQISFEEIFHARAGFGKYQWISYMVLGMIDFVDGIESVFSMFLPAIIQKEWNIDDDQVELLGSIFFVGSFFGFLFSGMLCDSIGRKYTMLLGNILTLGNFIYTYYVESFYEILFLRFIFGLVYTLTSPVSGLMISEMTPKDIRGRALTSLQLFVAFGKIYLIWVMSLFMNDLTTGNWRLVALSSSAPSILMILGNIFFIQESPRLYIVKEKYQLAEESINKIGAINKGKNYQKLTQEEIQNLKIWRQQNFREGYAQISGWSKIQDIFGPRYRSITWRFLGCSCVLSFVYSGLYLITPFIFSKENQGFFEIFLTMVVEVPSALLLFFVIDDQSYGRLKEMNATYSILILNLFAIWFFKIRYLVAGMMVQKFFMRIAITLSFSLTSESYSTMYRGIGLSLIGSAGRLFSATTPFALFRIFNQDNYAPFLIFTVLSSTCLILMLTFPIDLTGKEIDMKSNYNPVSVHNANNLNAHQTEEVVGLLDNQDKQPQEPQNEQLSKSNPDIQANLLDNKINQSR